MDRYTICCFDLIFQCIVGSHTILFIRINDISFSDDCFVLANVVYPDEMPLYLAYHPCIHCLPKYAFMSHKNTMGQGISSYLTMILGFKYRTYCQIDLSQSFTYNAECNPKPN